MYLAGVRSLHVAHSHHFTFNQQLTPHTTASAQRHPETASHRISTQDPSTHHHPDYGRNKVNSFEESTRLPQHHDVGSLLPSLFGFLRCSEFTVPSQGTYDSQVHLLPKDIAVDNQANPQLLRVVIKQSKTDPFRQGASLYLGKTDSSICPVTGILPFLAVRGNQDGPLFMLKDGRMLTRQLFSTFLDNILSKLKLNQSYFNTHSFRIGAATTAKEAGVDDIHIKMLGRWRSDIPAIHSHIPRATCKTFQNSVKALYDTKICNFFPV